MKTRDIVLMSLFAALIAALGLVPKIPTGIGVPVTAQTLGVMLAGAILGARRGAGACAIFVILVALGLPLLSGGRGGLGILFGPTGGFLLGWIPGAYLTGLICERMGPRFNYIVAVVGCIAGGIGVVYLLGIPWLMVVTDASLITAVLGSATFIPGDLLKSAVAALIAIQVHKSYPILQSAR